MQNIREDINAQVAPVVSYGATNETEEASLVPTPVTAPATKPTTKGWGPNAVVRALAVVVVSVLVAVVLVSSNKLTASSSSSPDLSKIEVNKDLADAVAMRAPKGNPGIFGAPPQAAPPAPAAPQAGPPTPAAPVAAPQAGPPTPAAPYAPPVEAPKTFKPVVDIGTFKPTVPVADPVPVQVIAARAVVKGCPGSLALSADFSGKFEAAMATEIRIGDASNVKVQDVTMSTDATKKTVFTITYVVKNFNVDLIRSVRNRVESRDTADNVAKVLMQVHTCSIRTPCVLRSFSPLVIFCVCHGDGAGHVPVQGHECGTRPVRPGHRQHRHVARGHGLLHHQELPVHLRRPDGRFPDPIQGKVAFQALPALLLPRHVSPVPI
jgi:hypothetical protein